MWAEDFFPDSYWETLYWPKEGSTPPVGGIGEPKVGLGQPVTTGTSPELGGGSW